VFFGECVFWPVMCAEVDRSNLPSRGLEWDIDQPLIRYSSIVAAVVSFVALVVFFPDHEKKASPKALRSRRLQALLVSLGGLGILLGILFFNWDWNVARLRRKPDAPSYKDLPICFFSFAFCSISRLVINPVFAALGRCVLSKEKYGDQFECRVQRFAGQCWKFLFHLTVTIVPILILPGQKWWPLVFAEDCTAVFENFPDVPNVRYLREFYMFELGYYLHAYVATLKQQNRPNYVEMVIHHVMTIVLIVYSYFLNGLVPYGTTILWVHDICDVPVCLTRLLLDFNTIIPTAISYFILMGCWVVFRLLIYPFILIPQVLYYGPHLGWFKASEFPGHFFICALLIGLAVMHVIWFKELFGMANVYFKTGKAKDSTDETKEDMDKIRAEMKSKKVEEEEKEEQPKEQEKKPKKKSSKTQKAD